MEKSVPAPDFSELASLSAKWGLATENERSALRWSSTPADFEALYSAVMPRLPEILDILSAYRLDSIPEPVKPLYWLTCAFAEAAPHHELYKGSSRVPHSFEAHRFRALHGDETC